LCLVRAWVAPLGAGVAWAVVGLGGGRWGQGDGASRKSKRIREARRRLSTAQKLRNSGRSAELYSEVEKALLQFLEAKLAVPVVGLTRDALEARMRAAGVSEQCRAQILRALEACDVARSAPGTSTPSEELVLEDARTAMESWEGR